jgi:xanthine dehydrogenase accessory factor
MVDWLDSLAAVRAAGTTAVLVTIVEADGSTPRSAGVRMVVAPGEVFGTIGGGNLEFRAIEAARGLLDAPARAPWLERYALGPSLGQCCGGSTILMFERLTPGDLEWVSSVRERLDAGLPVVLATRLDRVGGRMAGMPEAAREVAENLLAGGGTAPVRWPADNPQWLLEPVRPVDLRIVLFGAGHVGRALAQVLGCVPCAVTWVDGRVEAFPDSAPANVRVVATPTPAAAVRKALPGSYFLVMTHDHGLDLDLCEAVLRRGDFAFLGLIGSATKKARFVRRLAVAGLATERLVCPIGIDGIPGKHPGEIAVAVAADLLRRHAAGSGQMECGR